jgi:hypothetical protein
MVEPAKVVGNLEHFARGNWSRAVQIASRGLGAACTQNYGQRVCQDSAAELYCRSRSGSYTERLFSGLIESETALVCLAPGAR